MHLRHSIQVKIGVMLIVVTTLVLTDYGIVQYLTLQTTKLSQMHTFAENTLARMSESLIRPLWDCNDEQLEKVILSEMLENSVFAIVVKYPQDCIRRQQDESGKCLIV